MAKVKNWPIHIFIMLNTPTSLTEMPSISINDFINITYFQLLIPEIRIVAKLAKWLDYKLQKKGC